MRILLLDDNSDDRILASRALRQAFEGSEIREVATRADFERALEEDDFDVAITDYQLRWTDGIRVLETLIARFPSLPVVMYTNTGNEEVCAEAMKRGLSDYVIKRHGQYQRLAHAVRGVLQREELRGRVEALLAKEREAREEAERASRLKEEFLATLSHELRTPLHAVLGWTSLLRKGVLKSEADRQHALEVIEKNARAQTALIEELLDFSRLQSGKLQLDPQDTDLASLVLSAIAAVQPAASVKQIVLRPEIDEATGRATVDPARVRQMVLNLLTNAIKFSPENTEVHVRLVRTDGEALIEVRDQGAGIDAGFMPHIFDPFRQGEASATTRRSGGMGIGLAIVKKLAEAHGGSVHAESAGSGQGSTFTIRLPASEQRESERAPTPDREHPPSLEGLRVLAVDDEVDSLRYLERLLTHCHAEVHTANDATRALQLLPKVRPDVFVCDIGMPGTDGYELIEKVRCLEDEAVSKTPAVALTAFARGEDRQRALLAGFDNHISKPVDGYELIVLVASLAGVLQREKRCVAP